QVSYLGGQTPYFADATNVSDVKTYVFAKSSLLLTQNSQNVTVASGVTLANTPSAGGLMSGSMVSAQLSALNEMASQTVTYRWQTGENQWNQLRTLVNAQNAFVAFDAPMPFLYTHSEPSSPRWNNKVFRLEYEGSGQLNGIPMEQVAGTNRWYPVIA